MVTVRWPVHEEDEIAAVAQVLRSGKTNYWSGEHGQAFEREFAAQFTSEHRALAVSNGTTALECALHALRLDPGTEVIIPCRTFMATASAVVMNGCVPILADIDPDTLNVTVETLEARLTPNTAAVILVHYAGRPVDMNIYAWAATNDLTVIDDCAHAHGALQGSPHHGLHAGIMADIACFSFCVGKIMSTGGEGGMVVTHWDHLHKRMAAYRDHGRYQMVGAKDMTQFQWTVEEFGSNLRMTEMQAVIGRIQLKKLSGWVDRRRRIAKHYDEALGPHTGFRAYHPGHSFYMYLTRVSPHVRDDILKALNDAGVPARIGGCPNIGREKAFHGHVDDCPVADDVGKSVLALPVYPTMTDEDVEAVIKGVLQCV